MKFLTAISFELINRVRITIFNDIESIVNLDDFSILQSTANFKLRTKEGINTKLKIDEVYPSLETVQLFEEQSYYILVEQNEVINDSYFLNPFLNSTISWFPSTVFAVDADYDYWKLGNFKTKGNVGIWDFSTNTFSGLYLNILPTKIKSNEDYKILLADISDIISELVTKLGDIHKTPYSDSYEIANSLFLESIHLQAYIHDLLEAVDYVITSPYSNNIDELTYVQLGTQKEIDYVHFISSVENYAWRRNGSLGNRFKGYTPVTINNVDKIKNFNNSPNKFVKFVLEYILELIFEIKTMIENKSTKSNFDNIRLNELSTWYDEIEDRLNSNLFKSIGVYNFSSNTSQVLEKRVGYQEINRIYNNLQTAMEIDLESDIKYSDKYYSKPISDLYEIWCFLKVIQIVLEAFNYNNIESFISVVNNRLRVNLKQGQKSKITLNDNEKIINIYYNYLYSNPISYTESYRPDITIEIITVDQVNLHHFDAKYKMNNNDSFKEEDLWKMHAYKDAIKSSCTSSILYPGKIFKEYVKKDNTSINVIPLVPGDDKSFLRLRKFICKILNKPI